LLKGCAMKFRSIAVGSLVALVSMLAVAGCGGDESSSDIEAAAQTVVEALDELGIDHTDPVRAEVQGSGAAAVFEIQINGYDAGINVFADGDDLAAWQELSDAFGGVSVTFDNAAL